MTLQRAIREDLKIEEREAVRHYLEEIGLLRLRDDVIIEEIAAKDVQLRLDILERQTEEQMWKDRFALNQ